MASQAIYTPLPTAISKFLTHIQGAGVPPKMTLQYLESVGFKSKNDRPLITIFRALGFIDASGTPTDRWRAYRDKGKSRGILAAAITEAYSSLFETYPDAYRRDNEALRNYFSTHSSNLNDKTLQLVVRTFKTLADNADFGSPAAAHEILEGTTTLERTTTRRIERESSGSGGLTININIQLQLPASEDGSVYEKFFEAMNKTILARGRED